MNNYRLEFKWAVIYTMFLLVWMIFERLMGWHDTHIDKHHLYTLLFYIPAMALYYFAMTDKRNNYYGGIITFQQAFLSGLILTAFITFLAAPAQYIISTFITPYYFDNVITYAVNSGKTTPEEAQAFFNLQSYCIQAVVSSLAFGLVLSALVALLVKRK